MNTKRIKPGRWYVVFNERGERTAYVYEDSACKLLGYDSREEYISALGSWENAIHPDDIEGLSRYIADIEAKHPEGMDYDTEYRIMTKWGYHLIHDCGHVTRRNDGTPVRVDGAAYDIQDIVDKRELAELNEQLAKKQVQLEEALTFTDFLFDHYVSAYYLSLDGQEWHVYKRAAELERKYPINCNYFTSLRSYINGAVHPDDRAEMLKLLSPEYLRETLKDTSSFTHYFRDISTSVEKTYKVQVIRGADEDHAAFGFIDVTDEFREQTSKLLGAVPLSSDILTKANIGLWSFELDDGCAPRMYADEAMLGLIGLKHQIAPEDTYHAWYDHIDQGSYDLVADAVEKMVNGEHAEVQYPWHHPNGDTWIVRCGGVRNFEYTKGIRIEGTHQNVTQIVHFNEKERQRAKQLETDLAIEKLRTEELAYVTENEPDLPKALDFFGKRILETFGCDQVVFRSVDGQRIIINAPGIEDIPQEKCSVCPVADFDNEIYKDKDILVMNDCAEGYLGTGIHPNCSLKSSYLQRIYSNGELAGLFSVHYLKGLHTFSENGIRSLQTVGMYIGLMIGRVKEKQAEIAKIEAESSNKAKSEFLFNMSHDIRTPMNAITGYAMMAKKHLGEPALVEDYLQKIDYAGQTLLSLINQVLEMSRIESGNVELAEEEANMNERAQAMLAVIASTAKQADIRLDYTVNVRDENVIADAARMNRTISNILGNAVKYTPAGGSITYSVEQLEYDRPGYGLYRFTTRDTGIGMSKEYLDHIFEPFSRERTSTVSHIQGSGLGMPIVKKNIELMGGEINIRSEVGKGTEVVITVPMKIVSQAADTDVLPTALSSHTLLGKRVLLVEDNEMNREIARDILEDFGIHVEEAEDGSYAVDIMRDISSSGEDRFDLILMDIQMPIMNGYEATRKIRELPGICRTIPIIAMTANAFKEDKLEALKAGMNAHVPKPIDIQLLSQVMAELLK